MSDRTACPIWHTPAFVRNEVERDGKVVNSARTSGQYFISNTAASMLTSRDEAFRTRLTTRLVDRRWYGESIPDITSETMKEVDQRRPLSVAERADRTLKFLREKTKYAGDKIRIAVNRNQINELSKALLHEGEPANSDMWPYYNIMQLLACSESISIQESQFMLRYLDSQGWIVLHDPTSCALTVEGYSRLAALETIFKESTRAFVAMWFDPSMEDAWKTGVELGIRDAGYEPVRVDKKEHVNKIDDEIIAEIRRSRFVVADFTHGERGARGGVYYEAGFTHGLNIPVIFTCRKDTLESVHLDTRQYNHIVWETPEELRLMLARRIAAVIGDGPHRKGNLSE